MKINNNIEKVNHLKKLYYYFNNQREYLLQIQNKDGQFSKRYSCEPIVFDSENKINNKWWISRFNARTILDSEIVLDFDTDEKRKTKQDLFKYIYKYVIPYLKWYKNRFHTDSISLWDTTSNGYHIHIFNTMLIGNKMSKKRKVRINMINKFNCDTQKISENVTIALEYSKHWKTGKEKYKVMDI